MCEKLRKNASGNSFSSSEESHFSEDTVTRTVIIACQAARKRAAVCMTKRCFFSRGFTLAFTWPPSGSHVSDVHPDGRVGARQSGYALSVSWHINTNNTCSRWLGSLMEA